MDRREIAVKQFYILIPKCLSGPSVYEVHPPPASLGYQKPVITPLPSGQRMLWDRAVPYQEALLLSSSFGAGMSGGQEELVICRWFKHVRFAFGLLWLFHVNNTQCREGTAGHGFTVVLFLSRN